jgi:hypothetical protein
MSGLKTIIHQPTTRPDRDYPGLGLDAGVSRPAAKADRRLVF